MSTLIFSTVLAGILSWLLAQQPGTGERHRVLLFALVLGSRNLLLAVWVLVFIQPLLPARQENALMELSVVVLAVPFVLHFGGNLLRIVRDRFGGISIQSIPDHPKGHPLASLLFESSINPQLLIELELETDEVLLGRRAQPIAGIRKSRVACTYSLQLLARGYVSEETREHIFTGRCEGDIGVCFRIKDVRSAMAHRSSGSVPSSAKLRTLQTRRAS